ncbi:hypothetical protein [Actinopolymorpha alba]|uniref:hypothetical protein n=1 Tax=Actinopolymorpha alba TaxID=533267 RepID=UPI00039A3B64|nr:hypothetical protein [Actinopolymorpha alba]
MTRRIARIQTASSSRREACSRCLGPIPADTPHGLIGGERVGDCCLLDCERMAAAAADSERTSA